MPSFSLITAAVPKGSDAPLYWSGLTGCGDSLALASAIAQAAETAHADLIVMATHGKTHLDAFWSGSVAPKVSSRARLPLLLVPIVPAAPSE